MLFDLSIGQVNNVLNLMCFIQIDKPFFTHIGLDCGSYHLPAFEMQNLLSVTLCAVLVAKFVFKLRKKIATLFAAKKV
jgi:hypothetical protein